MSRAMIVDGETTRTARQVEEMQAGTGSTHAGVRTLDVRRTVPVWP